MRLAIAAVSFFVLAALPFADPAEAARGETSGEARSTKANRPTAQHAPARRVATRASYGFSGGISCVPYARAVTGMDVSGNGRDWWHGAAGRYARGHRPQEGSVLAFPGSGGMRMGHVAVVSRVVHPRLIEIDHANWGGPGIRRGTVMRDVRVVDVSPDNSWTRVRVQVGWDRETFGREYPTYGFIHNRPVMASADDDMIHLASFTEGAPAQASRRAAPRRPAAQRIATAQPRR
jgi:surface antigen